MRIFVGRAVKRRGRPDRRHTGRPLTEAWMVQFRERRNTGLMRDLDGRHRRRRRHRRIHTLYKGRIACASGADRFKVELQLEKCGLMRLLQGPHFQRARAAAPKPFPTSTSPPPRRLGVDPKRCAVVEDTVTGTTAGVAAVRTVFGFSPSELGHDAPKALKASGATHVFTDMA